MQQTLRMLLRLTPSSPSVQLGGTQQFSANASVTWSVMNDALGDALGQSPRTADSIRPVNRSDSKLLRILLAPTMPTRVLSQSWRRARATP